MELVISKLYRPVQSSRNTLIGIFLFFQIHTDGSGVLSPDTCAPLFAHRLQMHLTATLPASLGDLSFTVPRFGISVKRG